jgi:hypothetical protein
MTLDVFLKFFALPHAVAGTLALGLFWLAAASRKGSWLHRKLGQCYLVAMALIVITAVPLVASSYLRGQLIAALFLAYLVLLVSLGCRNALMAIRCRRSPERFTGRDLQILALLTGLAGLLVVAVGWHHQVWILIIFGLIGPINLVQAIRLIRRQRQGIKLAPNWWLKEHYGAMIGNGVATHIAFFQIGLTRAFPNLELGVVQPLAWFGPLLAAVLASLWLDRRYGQRQHSVASSTARLS